MWSDLNWKSLSPCSWQKKNEGQTYDLRLRLSIKKACGAFENQLQENSFDGGIDYLRLIAHLKSKSTSPIVFQIHFQNQFPEWNSSEQVAEDGARALQLSQSSRQRYRAMAILQSKIQNNSLFRIRKTILTGGCLSENHIHSCQPHAIIRSLKLILIWDFSFLMKESS